jgi:hypothetical protein
MVHDKCTILYQPTTYVRYLIHLDVAAQRTSDWEKCKVHYSGTAYSLQRMDALRRNDDDVGRVQYHDSLLDDVRYLR